MNNFEKVSDKVDHRNNYETSAECAIEWVNGNRTATVTFPNRSKYTSKIKKLPEEFPDEVKITHTNLDGSIVATIPTKYVKISHPKKVVREYTEEEREALRIRMKNMQAAKAAKKKKD